MNTGHKVNLNLLPDNIEKPISQVMTYLDVTLEYVKISYLFFHKFWLEGNPYGLTVRRKIDSRL